MRWQFLRFYIGIVVVLMLSAMVFYFFVRRDFEKSMDERLERSLTPWVEQIREKLAEAPEDREVRTRMLEEIEYKPRYPSHRGGGRGWPPPSRLLSMDDAALAEATRERLANGEVVVVRSENKRTIYAAVPGEDIVAIEAPSRMRRERDSGTRSSMLMLLAPPLAILMLIGVAIYLLIRPIERRISSLVEVNRSFGEGVLNTRVQVGHTGAIDELEESFNAMASRIEQLVDGQRELMRAVSHDLRTPLARIFFALDDAQMAGTVGEKNQHLKRIDGSLVELNDLVEELLSFLRLDESGMKPEREWVDLAPILWDAAELVSDLRPEVVLETSCNAPRVFADRRYLKRAIGNLVTNAVAHAKKGVWIRCRVENDFFLLSVEDDGPGIPEEERAKVFEPFYRRDQSRNANLGGSGLGLAIVSRIMTWHEGSVQVIESPHGGACFTLFFPGEA